ncbi:MAG: type II 3-dehydroquinate dehydratase [Crocinitomicaceae bacterium]
MSAKRILIINGPNLNLLGKREPGTYGSESFEDFFVKLKTDFSEFELSYFQSNVEGELITKIQEENREGMVLNAGGYTHTSVAIRDAISAVQTQVVEVHISNIAGRESFRHDSLISPVCTGCITGFGLDSYRLALEFFKF